MNRFHILTAILVGLLFLGFSDNHINNKPVDIYEKQSIQGFNVFVEKKALEINEELTNQALELLDINLKEIGELGLNPSILNQLKLVPIFMDWNTTSGGAVYHPSIQWLLDNGYYEGKEKSIEISNIRNYLNWSNLNQPYMILHELSHAYHDRVLGFDNTQILNAYNSAIASKRYVNIKYHNGDQVYSIASEAYSITNEIEFFAELSEAYFGLNDYYPFKKSDLQTYDPKSFEVIKLAWKQ